jgi:hypothetical protein
MALTKLTDREAVDRTIQYVDKLDPTLPSAELRVNLYAQFLQEAVVDLWMEREPPWTFVEDSVTVDADGSFVLPDDFFEIGRSGALIDPATGDKFTSKDLQEMKVLLAQPGGSGRDFVYALGEYNADDSDDRYGWVPQAWSGATLTLVYRTQPPEVDVTDEATTTAMEWIPAVYHYSLILPYLRWRAFEDTGDARATIWLAKYQAGMGVLAAKEKTGPQKDSVKRIGGYGMRHRC